MAFFAADRTLFYTVNRWPEAVEPFFFFLSESNKWPAVRVALLAICIGLLIWRPSRFGATIALMSWPLANGITDVLKAWLEKPRPCVELPDVILRVPMLTSYGTASAHSANMAAVAFAFWWLGGWKVGLPWALLALFTGISRIYVGVHYPSQVLSGWLCGCFAAFLVGHTVMAGQRVFSKKPQQKEDPS